MNQIFLPEYPFSYKLSASVFKCHHTDQCEEVRKEKLFLHNIFQFIFVCLMIWMEFFKDFSFTLRLTRKKYFS